MLSRNGAKETRTPDPLNAIEVRYQLRYSPVCVFYDAAIDAIRQASPLISWKIAVSLG